jgi:hypothetical protein
VEVVRHDDEFMQQIAFGAIVFKDLNKESGHSISLEQSHLLIGAGGHKVSAVASVAPVRNVHNSPRRLKPFLCLVGTAALKRVLHPKARAHPLTKRGAGFSECQSVPSWHLSLVQAVLHLPAESQKNTARFPFREIVSGKKNCAGRLSRRPGSGEGIYV